MISLSHGENNNNHNPPPTTKEDSQSHIQNHQSHNNTSEDTENVLLRTPSRRRTSAQFTPFTPVTPRKLMFMGVATESPLRGLFDHPHDPGTLLDEELARLCAQTTPGRGGLHESPSVGFAQRALLYESPNTRSPERWTRMW
jgi:hypothetical protein